MASPGPLDEHHEVVLVISPVVVVDAVDVELARTLLSAAHVMIEVSPKGEADDTALFPIRLDLCCPSAQ